MHNSMILYVNIPVVQYKNHDTSFPDNSQLIGVEPTMISVH